ncbi:MAG TPA: hypothetical protein VKI44_12475 [Acetobacteraceae bacterium]|nr:hypothetical protein [Acetobacteraceae bacterium]
MADAAGTMVRQENGRFPGDSVESVRDAQKAARKPVEKIIFSSRNALYLF